MSDPAPSPPAPAVLSPLCCGTWDGANLWLQWDAAPSAPLGYCVRIRLRAKEADEWGKWIVIARAFTKPWTVVQTMREGWQVQAQVVVADVAPAGKSNVPSASDAAWAAAETADEVTFARCTATFSFSLAAAAPPLPLQAGTSFDAYVDRAACSYRLTAPLVVPSGQVVTAVMESVQVSAWMQIDNAGDFISRPMPGMMVTNTVPSTAGITKASPARQFTTLAKGAPGGPGALVRAGRRWMLPTS